MRKKAVKKVIPIELIKRLYCDENLTLNEVAQKFGVTHQAVQFRLRKAGIPRRPRRPEWKPIEKKVLKKLYLDDVLTLKQIGELFGMDGNTVRRSILHHKIPTRGHGPPKNRSIFFNFRLGDVMELPRPEGKAFYVNYYIAAKRMGISISIRTTPTTVKIRRIK